MSDTCAAEGCEKPRHGTYCQMHARRLERWGDLHANQAPEWPDVEPLTPDEEWRPVPGHQADYRVSSEGRILGRRRQSSTNLAYGTPQENAEDAIRHGQNTQSAKTHCPQGHPYEGRNLIVGKSPKGGVKRQCRACLYESNRRRRERKRAVGPTVNDLATFLLQHVEWISAQPFADEPAEHFHELTTQAKALAYPREVRRFVCAACVEVTACDVDSRTETRCGGDLVATIKVEEDEDGLLPAEVACRLCGQSWSSGQWMTLGRHIREAS